MSDDWENKVERTRLTKKTRDEWSRQFCSLWQLPVPAIAPSAGSFECSVDEEIEALFAGLRCSTDPLSAFPLPAQHPGDKVFAPRPLQVEFVTDSKILHQISNAIAVPGLGKSIDLFETIVDTMQTLLELGVSPRVAVLPLVVWRRRKWNILADRAAGEAMKGGSSFKRMAHDLDDFFKQVDKNTLLQIHTDGANSKPGGIGATGVSWTLWKFAPDVEATREIVKIGGAFLPQTTAIQAEGLALLGEI